MYDLLDELGLDDQDVRWQNLALCQGMQTEWFYDLYEKDGEVARASDEACLRCPVKAQCFLAGQSGEYGVWGGVFWNGSGKPDKNKNSHKSDDTWTEIYEGVKEHLQSRDSDDL